MRSHRVAGGLKGQYRKILSLLGDKFSWHLSAASAAVPAISCSGQP